MPVPMGDWLIANLQLLRPSLHLACDVSTEPANCPYVTVGPARIFCRPFRVERSNFDRPFSGTRTVVHSYRFCLRALVLRPIAGPARELHVTNLPGARERARLVLLNQFELRD